MVTVQYLSAAPESMKKSVKALNTYYYERTAAAVSGIIKRMFFESNEEMTIKSLKVCELLSERGFLTCIVCRI